MLRTWLQSIDPSVRRGIGLAVFVFVILFTFFVSFESFERVDANEILIVQSPVAGKLKFYASPGLKPQWFGRTITFPKVMTYQFVDTVRFNEGGHATVVGSVQFRLPTDPTALAAIYTTYGSARNLQDQLLETVTDKSIFMSGPLLSSTESYAEKRSNLIFWIEDQIAYGVYHTIRRDVKTKDPVTGEDKTISVAEIALTAEGSPQRQEISQLQAFGISPFNFAVSRMPYDTIVEKQIQSQQVNAMAVATAMAQARRAEQQTLTAEQEGHAIAATARWRQEAIKAESVTVAQRTLEVAKLRAQAAEQYKREQTLIGEGDGARQRALMVANNALELRLGTYERIMTSFAENLPKSQQALVPQIVFGGSDKDGGSQFSVNQIFQMLGVKFATDLGLGANALGPRATKSPE